MKPPFTIGRAQIDGVSTFLSVAEHRSFRAAADELGISPSAVSQAVRALEKRVGVALLARTTRNVGLTDAGRTFLARARPAMADLAAAFEDASNFGKEATGLLRLHMPRTAAAFLLEPVLSGFCAAYPKVELEIFTDDGLVNLIDAGFDAGIRLGERLEADMVAVRLTPHFRFAVAGSPEYFAEHGRPARPADLRDHDCIRYGRNSHWKFLLGGRSIDVAVKGSLIVNDVMVALGSALRGAGLMYVAQGMLERHVEAGLLELVLSEYGPSSSGVFLYYPNRSQVLPKLRAFIDYVRVHQPWNSVDMQF